VTSAAPAPLVPRLRNSSILGRPNTAPDEQGAPSDPAFQSRPKSSGKARSRRDSLRQTVGFLRKTGSQGDLQKTQMRSGRVEHIHPPPVPPIPAAHSPAPSGTGRFPRSDAASLSLSTSHSLSDNLNRGPGFVDILDAQGEIRPSDFRSRLQAAGARDYGEDVAERNMGVNGVDLTSSAVTAYYATSSEQPEPGRRSDAFDLLAQRPRTVTYPKRVDSFDNVVSLQRDPHSQSRHIKADCELESQTHYRKSGSPFSSSKHRPSPLNLQPIISNSSSESAAEPPEVPRSRATSNSQKSWRADKVPASPRWARDSILVAKEPRWPLTSDLASPTLQVPSRPHTRESAKKWRSKRNDEQMHGIGELALESMADVDFASAAPAPSTSFLCQLELQPLISTSRYSFILPIFRLSSGPHVQH
jgi:hypothetical protein